MARDGKTGVHSDGWGTAGVSRLASGPRRRDADALRAVVGAFRRAGLATGPAGAGAAPAGGGMSARRRRCPSVLLARGGVALFDFGHGRRHARQRRRPAETRLVEVEAVLAEVQEADRRLEDILHRAQREKGDCRCFHLLRWSAVRTRLPFLKAAPTTATSRKADELACFGPAFLETLSKANSVTRVSYGYPPACGRNVPPGAALPDRGRGQARRPVTPDARPARRHGVRMWR